MKRSANGKIFGIMGLASSFDLIPLEKMIVCTSSVFQSVEWRDGLELENVEHSQLSTLIKRWKIWDLTVS